eukprot:1150565-Pelagomonas_calceolata.AAC.13
MTCIEGSLGPPHPCLVCPESYLQRVQEEWELDPGPPGLRQIYGKVYHSPPLCLGSPRIFSWLSPLNTFDLPLLQVEAASFAEMQTEVTRLTEVAKKYTELQCVGVDASVGVRNAIVCSLLFLGGAGLVRSMGQPRMCACLKATMVTMATTVAATMATTMATTACLQHPGCAGECPPAACWFCMTSKRVAKVPQKRHLHLYSDLVVQEKHRAASFNGSTLCINLEKHRAAKVQFDKVKGVAQSRKADLDSIKIEGQIAKGQILRDF